MGTIQLDNIHKLFDDVHVIKGVSLEITEGEFVVFVGPSGCGKSTMLRLVAGLEEATSGRVLIDGEDVTALGASERGLAMVFQSYALYPHMTVRENMGFGLKIAGRPREDIDAEVAKAADVLQLGPLLDRKPKELSGGQRQRVAIGRAIVRAPAAFLFDEPLSNLDAALRVQMRIEIARLHKQLDKSMIYVTHDQVEAMTLADRIVVFDAGHIQQAGAPLDLYRNPSNLFVATFIGSPQMNIVPCSGRLAEGRVALSDGGGAPVSVLVDAQAVPGTEDDSATQLGVRPEHIEIVPADDADIRGEVGVLEQLGGDTFIYVDSPGVELLTVRVPGISAIREGEAIGLRVPPQHAHLFNADGAALTQRVS